MIPSADPSYTAPTRREFCLRGYQAVSLLTLGAVLPACGGSPTSPSAVGRARVVRAPPVPDAFLNNVVTISV